MPVEIYPTWRSEVTPLQEQPDSDAPYTVNIVVDTASPNPSHEDTLIAVSRGIALLLTDPELSEDAEASALLRSWSEGDLRKVVRTCKSSSSRWADLVEAGATVRSAHGRTQILVLLPLLNGEFPKAVSRLQVRIDLPVLLRPREDVTPGELLIAMNPDVSMTTGKAAAQAGHIAHLAVLQSSEEHLGAWADTGYSVMLVPWEETDDPQFSINDNGHTEVPSGTLTARGRFA